MALFAPRSALYCYLHRPLPKTLFLLALSFFTFPLSAFITICSILATRLLGDQIRQDVPYCLHGRKTILVTGVSMAKGLAISRLLAQWTPHHIIGADVEPIPFTNPGRYSRSLSKFHRLSEPHGDDYNGYIKSLLSVIRRENVDLWISCSSVGSAVHDAVAAHRAQELIGIMFKAIQMSPEMVMIFDEKDRFISHIASIGLPIPESHLCTSVQQAENILAAEKDDEDRRDPKGKQNYTRRRSRMRRRYILKPIGINDRSRGKMTETILPLSAPEDTRSYLSSLGISKETPFQLQQYIAGQEYCTHALVIRGVVKAFVACRSSDLLMHYKAMNPQSPLHQQMLKFTEKVAEAGGKDLTGHLSFDFIAEWRGNTVRLYPIECNPRAHTAVLLFSETPEMAEAYLDVFEDGSRRKREGPIFPQTPGHGHYWIEHDLMTLGIMPLVKRILGQVNTRGYIRKQWMMLWEHIVSWKDGTYATWDPMPFLVLYHVYWPLRLLTCLVKGEKWSR